MSDMNSPAFFTTVFSFCLMAAYLLSPSPVLSISLVLFLPLAITVVALAVLEYHQRRESWLSAEEEGDTGSNYSHHCSLLK